MEEKVYLTMKYSGVWCIVMGIVSTVVGISVGVGSIVIGSLLLKKKSDLSF